MCSRRRSASRSSALAQALDGLQLGHQYRFRRLGVDAVGEHERERQLAAVAVGHHAREQAAAGSRLREIVDRSVLAADRDVAAKLVASGVDDPAVAVLAHGLREAGRPARQVARVADEIEDGLGRRVDRDRLRDGFGEHYRSVATLTVVPNCQPAITWSPAAATAMSLLVAPGSEAARVQRSPECTT